MGYVHFGEDAVAKPAGMLDHHTGAIATRSGQVELIQVELIQVDLTPKTVHRYKMIRHNHASRLSHEGVARIRYFCMRSKVRSSRRRCSRSRR